jgi:hypothetical protein
MSSRTITTAKVTLTLDIMVDDTWGGDCATDQVFRQAEQSAIGMIRQWKDSLPPHRRQKVQIVGTPKVEAISRVKES